MYKQNFNEYSFLLCEERNYIVKYCCYMPDYQRHCASL